MQSQNQNDKDKIEVIENFFEALEDDVEVPKKILRKMSKAFHKQNISEIVTEVEDIEALMEATK